MIWALLTIFGNATEQILIGYFILQTDPLNAVPFFYLLTSLFCIATPIALGFRNGHPMDLLSEKKLVFIFVFASASGNALWFSALCLWGLSGTALVLIALRVILIFYGTYFLKEKMAAKQWFAAVMIIGLLALFTNATPPENTTGVILAFLSVILYAIEDITEKALSSRVEPTHLMSLRQIVALILFTIVALLVNKSISFEFLSQPKLAISIVVAAFIGGPLVCHARFYAYRALPISLFSLISSFKPVLIVVGSMIFLGEEMTNLQMILAAMMLAITPLLNKPSVNTPN